MTPEQLHDPDYRRSAVKYLLEKEQDRKLDVIKLRVMEMHPPIVPTDAMIEGHTLVPWSGFTWQRPRDNATISYVYFQGIGGLTIYTTREHGTNAWMETLDDGKNEDYEQRVKYMTAIVKKAFPHAMPGDS